MTQLQSLPNKDSLHVGVGDIHGINFATVITTLCFSICCSIHSSIQFQADLMWSSVKDVPQYFDVKMSKHKEIDFKG